MESPLLDINDLNIEFKTKAGIVKVSQNVSFKIKKNETICIVGESGCGKSVVAMSIAGLLPENARISGEIKYKGKNLLNCSPKELVSYRGKEIAMIFEQPMSCLNPVMSIGNQIAEAFKANSVCSKQEAMLEAKNKLEEVGIPTKRYNDFPHELSGGMQQRVMIAMALACKPSLLIADEPTTALDVTVQYQILELLQSLKEKYSMSLMIITHDLGVVAEMADKVGVMYAGTLLELSSVNEFFYEPLHPYSKALMNVVVGNNLNPIKGNVINLTEEIDGCPFYKRCAEAYSYCKNIKPKPRFINDRMERCHFVGDDSDCRVDKIVLSV